MTGTLELPGLNIRAAAEALGRGDMSAVELTGACLARIERLDPLLHAMVVTAADPAVAAASAARAGRSDGTVSLLSGIPVVVKDIIDVAGVPTRCGSATRDAAPPAPTDAPVVSALRAAGAVILGKSVTQEFAAGTVSPPARNPWNPDRIPGGSSGGAAVAVAAGMALAGIGSDTGGSIRNPAAICGVAGLKPTFGALATAGVFPLAWSLDTVGPLARTVDDVWLTYAAMRGDTDDSDLAASLSGVRLGLLRGYFADRIAPEVRAAVDAAAATMRDLGATVLELEWSEAAAARAVAFILNRVETVAVHRDLLRGPGTGLDLLNPGLRLRLVAGQLIPAPTYVRALGAREAIKQSMARLFREHRLDAVLAPTSPATAALATRPVVTIDAVDEDANLAYTRLTQPFNTTGQPVLSVPCGFDAASLPIGMQIAGRPWAERGVCEIGHAYEVAAGWHRSVPPAAGQPDRAATHGV